MEYIIGAALMILLCNIVLMVLILRKEMPVAIMRIKNKQMTKREWLEFGRNFLIYLFLALAVVVVVALDDNELL